MNLLFFSALTMFINCGSVKWATRIQDTFTFGKLIALVILIVIGLIEVGSGKQKQVQVWHLNNNIIIIIIIFIFTQTLNTWNILGMFYEISRAKKVLWCCTSPASQCDAFLWDLEPHQSSQLMHPSQFIEFHSNDRQNEKIHVNKNNWHWNHYKQQKLMCFSER